MRSGVGGFIANAVGGNVVSGAIDLARSFGSGEAGGHSVFYNMGLGAVAGPLQGFGGLVPSLANTPWSKDVVGFALESIPYVGEYASGFGEVKAIYDGVAYLGSVTGCALGIIH